MVNTSKGFLIMLNNLLQQKELVGNKIANKIRRISRISPQNNSEENIKHDTEIHREKYVYSEQRQKNY